MPTLSLAKLNITLVSGTSNVDIAAMVTVTFSPQEEILIRLLSLTYTLRSEMWASDSGLNGDDDKLFSIGSKSITASGTYPFPKKTINRSSLNEDTADTDEVYARFGCTPPSNTGIALTSATPINSAVITGSF